MTGPTRSVRKYARLLSLDYCFPSLCHKSGSCRFHYPCTDLAYVDDAESGSGRHFSPLARSRGSIITPMGSAGMTKVDLQPVLDCDAAITYTRNYASKLETVSDGCHHAWTTSAHTCLKTSRRQRGPAFLDFSAQQTLHLQLGDHLVDA